MKNLFKLTAAAVALFTLASCAEDDVQYGSKQGVTAANEMKIIAEEMDGGNLVTRSAYVGTTNARVWQETDEFKVFGPQVVGQYDYYKFSKASNKFLINGTKDLETASFVGFPRDLVNGQNWIKEDQAAYLEYTIPDMLPTYDEVAGSDPVAYVSNLPLWGTAENDGEGISAKVYFLTAIIKVSLENAASNATDVRIIAYKDIAGTSDPAIISGSSWVQLSDKGTVFSPSEVQLPAPTAGQNYVRMPLGDLTSKAATSVVYLPLIAGTYGNVKVQYSTDNGTNWTDIQVYKNKEFKRATCYAKNNTKTFDAAVTDIAGLNALLATKTAETGEIEIKAANNLAVATATTGSEIIIPAMPNVTKLTLDFATGKTFTATSTETLKISGDYAGTLVFDPAFGTNVTTLTIELPKANVVLGGGTWANVTTMNLNYAKALQFGGLLDADSKEVAANFTAVTTKTYRADIGDIIVAEKATGVGDITLAADHMTTKLDVKGTAGDITVPASDVAATMAVNVSGTAGAIAINGATNNATVNLTGVATSITNQGTGAITISGAPNYATANYSKVGTVSTPGNVTINLDNEGAAIETSLTFTKPATLTLTQGYVKSIIVNSAKATDVVAITLGDSKYNNIGGITLTKGKVSFAAASKWNGEKIGGSVDTEAEWKAAGLDAAPTAAVTAWKAYKNDGTAVYTAIDLAENAGAFTLANDIDLDNKAWTPATTTGDINGGSKTIKNLTVAVPADKAAATAATDGLGLFSDLKNDVTSLTLDGVTIAAVEYTTGGNKYQVKNIGALAGKLSTAAEIKNVNIKNIALSSTNGGGTIGGVIGTNTAAATLTGVTVSGTNSIKGYGNLGGLIGYAAENVTIAKCAKDNIATGTPAADVITAATVSFTANFNSYSDAVTNDLTYLKVGNMIGSADNAKKIVMTDIAADFAPALTYDKSIYTGTSKYQTVSEGVTKSYDYVFDKQTLIGYSGDVAFTTAPKLNTKDYQVLTNKAAVEALPANAQYYLYYINK